jgi:hypothetical protein
VSTVQVFGVGTADDTTDGNVQVTVNAGAVTALDGSGNANTASNTATIVWDANTAPTVTATSGSWTGDTLTFLVSFGQHLVQPLDASEVNAPSVTVNPVAPPVTCPTGASTASECYDVSVTGMSPGQLVSVSINAGVVTGIWGLPNQQSNVAQVMWNNALTITAAPGSGLAAFSGTGSAVPGDGTVIVDVCTDQTCTAPPTLTVQNVPVDPTNGNWQVASQTLTAGTYWARATQTQSGLPVTAFTGPFVVS